MAVVIEFWVSAGGVGEGDFSLLATQPDSGGATYDYSAGLTPGNLYLFRARRRDTLSSLVSGWSAIVLARAPYPLTEDSMANPETTFVGAEAKLGIGLEVVQGYPVVAQALVGLRSCTLARQNQIKTSKTLRNKRTRAAKLVKGKSAFTGSLTFELTPEGAVPRLLQACLAFDSTTTLSTPTRYRHRFSNKFGSKTATLTFYKAGLFYLYPGARLTSLRIEWDRGDDDVMVATADIIALDEIIVDAADVGTVEADTDMDTAAEDTLPPYTVEDATASLLSVADLSVRTARFGISANYGLRDALTGKRGIVGTFEQAADVEASFTVYVDKPDLALLDDGVAASTATPLTPAATLQTGAASVDVLPPSNGSFVNQLTLTLPTVAIQTGEPVDGDGEIMQDVTLTPIDTPGGSAATDFYLEITNGLTQAQVTAQADPIPIALIPVSAVKDYTGGAATGTPTTTSVAMAATSHLSATDDAYNGRQLVALSGTYKGESRLISDYVGASRTFTVAAFSGAPAAADRFAVV